MKEACFGDSGGRAARRNPRALRAGHALAFAASPTFAAMALLTGVMGGPAATVCSTMGLSPLSGMGTMYLLMSLFHAAPWLDLIRASIRRSPRAG